MIKILLLAPILFLITSCTDENSQDKCTSEFPAIMSASSTYFQDVNLPFPQSSLNLEPYASCEQLEKDLVDRFSAIAEEYKNAPSYSSYNANSCHDIGIYQVDATHSQGSGSQPQGGITNAQIAGVDEGDIVKISPHHIFVAKPDFIEILDRHSLSLVYSLDSSNLRNVELFYGFNILMVKGDIFGRPGMSQILIYRTSANSKPILTQTFTIEGTIIGSRMKDSVVSIISTKPLLRNLYTSDEQAVKNEIRKSLNGISCSRVFKGGVSDADSSMTTIHQFDLNQPSIDEVQTILLGRYSELFMTQDNLYLTKKGLQWFYWDSRHHESLNENFVAKINMKHPIAVPESMGEFQGNTIGSWAYGEVQGALAVATTSSTNRTSTNNLYLLKTNSESGELEKIASVENFGLTETIRSVRYMNDKAYIVTFKKTDPLFVIDLKDPTQPEIRSELKAPGFSRYMHPIQDEKLLGLGFGADDMGSFAWFTGVQLSLFDIADDYNPQTVQQIVHGDRGSFSEVLFNHQAFYYNSRQSLVGFPLVEARSVNSTIHGSKTIEFSGAQFYKIEDSGFRSLGRISHSHWMDTSCSQYDPNRFWWTSLKSLSILVESLRWTIESWVFPTTE